MFITVRLPVELSTKSCTLPSTSTSLFGWESNHPEEVAILTSEQALNSSYNK